MFASLRTTPPDVKPCYKIPQGDILSFHPTLLLLPVGFITGYYFFSTYWVPRILLTLKARHWVTQFQVLPVGFLLPGGEWPEIFLMFVQFGGLVLLVSQLGVAAPTETLSPPEQPATPVVALTTPADTKVHLWRTIREYFGYRPRAVVLATLTANVLQGCTFYTPGGKTFPTLVARLRQSLLAEIIRLSGTPGEELHLG